MHIITSVCLCVLHVCMCVCHLIHRALGEGSRPLAADARQHGWQQSLSLSLCIIACTQSDRWREGRDPSQQTKGLNPKPRTLSTRMATHIVRTSPHNNLNKDHQK